MQWVGVTRLGDQNHQLYFSYNNTLHKNREAHGDTIIK